MGYFLHDKFLIAYERLSMFTEKLKRRTGRLLYRNVFPVHRGLIMFLIDAHPFYVTQHLNVKCLANENWLYFG